MASILLIEADEGFSKSLSNELTALGYSVLLSNDCKDGLKQAIEQRPSAIVLCVELPRTSGFSLLNKLKKEPGVKHIPVVMTSSEESKDAFEERKRLPVHSDDYLLKPFTTAALHTMLQPLLSRPPPPPEPVVEPPPPAPGKPKASQQTDSVIPAAAQPRPAEAPRATPPPLPPRAAPPPLPVRA